MTSKIFFFSKSIFMTTLPLKVAPADTIFQYFEAEVQFLNHKLTIS